MAYVLVGSFQFVPERAEFIGVVAKQEGKDLTIVTVGIEATEYAILMWIKDTITLMRAAGSTEVQAPDMYDRMRNTPAH